ncbi:MAG TPA: hypothetical protein VEO36_08420 [Casimicrobiaceae bacterium]|nr:hypothetical protein [Casimicrobiaceae bacterium]
MNFLRVLSLLGLAVLISLGGCATRPVNPPIAEYVPDRGYQYSTRVKHAKDPQNLVILAFSGGGTRAAAFSYGVLEALRHTEVVGPKASSFGCSTKSTSSPAYPAAASPRWPTACMAKNCSINTRSAS